MALISFILKRLVTSFIIIFVIVLLAFIMINLAPGDPAVLLAGEAATPEYLNNIRKAYGLDKPLYERLFIYITNFLKGDWGYSLSYQMPVINAIMNRLPQTLLLVGVALTLSIIIGIFIGVISSSRAYSLLDHMLSSATLILYSIPVFWLGLMLILSFSLYLPIFPTGGMYDIGISRDPMVLIPNILWHMVLPVITLASLFTATYARITRSVMIDVLRSNYILAAIAKGIPRRRILYRHALRNALIPIIAVAGAQFGQIVAGAVLTETIYSWPGIGTLLVQAVSYRDYPLITGILLLTGIAVAISNFIADIIMARIDPRIRSRLIGG
jgi:peptide/nickel transport system permease protein